MLINSKESLLLIVDVQEVLTPLVESSREVITLCSRLTDIAGKLEIPLMITEQYPKGLGPTMIDIRNNAPENQIYPEKLEFSCAKNKAIMSQLNKHKKKQIILAGIETHICVLQTAIDLKEKGLEVFVVADACSSRKGIETSFALQRMMDEGINIVTFEMVVFEWLEKAGTKEFKDISQKYLK